MALSQVQCLDNYHINLRTTASKPEFLYSEDQRLALEMLLQTGQDAFEDYIKTNNIRSFLSDIELERFLNNAEVFSPGYPDDATDGCEESQGGEVSLQYWPERSDRSTPRLDIGWPDRVSYRGVTRVQVYTQPAYEGQPHIKEVVRKMISHAQKVIAIVMDLFTDIDIFKDLLDASYRRKVAVYIILDTTGVKHFMRMCEKAEMHSGHLKNLRVRCIRGSQFFSRSSKRLCGSQSQKFMFIDGDKAVSGSYSFTWSASRLDRNLITVLRGQAVETFDTLFQDMYMLSNGVCLSRLHFSNEPEPEDLPQVVPTVLLSSTQALKLINPKYSLVSNCAFTTIGSASGLTSGEKSASKKQTEFFKPIKDTKVSNIHPGLLNLEKANMIHYIPTWPDPEPPSDVIGFINIRDSNKPLQAHLTRSELYEISQAVRFKDPTGSSPLISQVPPDSESRITPVDLLSGDPIRISEKQDAVIVFECNEADIKELNLTEKDLDTKSRESKEDHSDGMPSFSKDSTILDPKQIQDHLQPPKWFSETSEILDLKLTEVSCNTRLNQLFLVTKLNSNQNSCNATVKSNCDSSRSSMSDEYYECLSPESVEDEGTDSWLNPVINGEQQDIVLNRHDRSDLAKNQSFYTPQLLKTSCSIIFNFLADETSTNKRDKERMKNESPVNVSDYFSQDPDGCFNHSSTSEEYFECSEKLGLKSEIANMVPNLCPFKPSKKLQQQPIMEAKELSRMSHQNTWEDYETRKELTEFRHLGDDVETVLESNDNNQIQSDENVHSYETIDSEVTSDQVVDHNLSTSDVLQNNATNHQSLGVQTKVEFNESMAVQHLQPDRHLKGKKKFPNSDAKSEVCQNQVFERQTVMLNLEQDVFSHLTESPHGRSVELDKADFTSAFQKPVDLPTSEELKVLASGNVGSKNRIIAKHEEHDNYNLRVHNYGVTPVVMKGNSNMDNHQKKLQDHLESTKLVIVKNDSDAVRSKGAQLTSKSDSKEPKANGEEKKLGQQVCGRNGKKICYPTAQALEKREVEHIQMNTRMPEAQLKREFLGRKQPYQASSKIPVHSRRRLTKFPIAIPDSCRNFFGLGPPKDGVYKLGKARELKSVSITPSPSAQKVPKGAIRTTKIPQRSTWMVPPTNSHHSPPKHQKFHPDN